MKKDELGEMRSTKEIRNLYNILFTKPMEKLVLGDLGTIGKILLK
jgi:hypothetical protein